ncbi:MAG: metallophosphoesterase [Nitrospirae bacterium]|nr:metallophosphoesterase [Nitrospirota bacterium]
MRNKTLFIASIIFSLVILQGLGAFAANVAETAPATPSQDSFSFVVWGHPRGRATGEPPLHFEEILERIAELKADLLIITGDAIQGQWGQKTDPAIITADWEKFDAGVNRLDIPVYRIPGNHDVHNNVTRDVYLSRYPRPPYAFTLKGSRFILLDTAGIKQQGKDDQATWDGLSQPFDDEQFGFIKDEIGRQGDYNHIFIFMHNPQPWSEPETFWWKNIHTLLSGGKTRAVFAGSPWYFKYAHMEQDGIHYILSSCLSAPPKEFFRMFPNPDEWAIHKQLDNIQYVRVEGDKYLIRTIAVGALSSGALNWRFWDEVENRPPRWAQKVLVQFYKKFYKPEHLALLAAAFGGVCLLLGAFLTALWMRRRCKK